MTKKLFVQPKETKEVRLHGDLLHYSFNTHEDFRNQSFRFAEMKGESYFSKGKKNASLLKIISPMFFFIKNYFLKLGFLDGKDGFRICLVYAFFIFIISLKGLLLLYSYKLTTSSLTNIIKL